MRGSVEGVRKFEHLNHVKSLIPGPGKSSVRGGEAALPRASEGEIVGSVYNHMVADQRLATNAGKLTMVAAGGTLPHPTPEIGIQNEETRDQSKSKEKSGPPGPATKDFRGDTGTSNLDSNLQAYVHQQMASKPTAKTASSDHGSTTSSQRCRELEKRLEELERKLEEKSSRKSSSFKSARHDGDAEQPKASGMQPWATLAAEPTTTQADNCLLYTSPSPRDRG